MTNILKTFSQIDQFIENYQNELNINNGFEEIQDIHNSAFGISSLETENQIILSFIKHEELSFFNIQDILDTGEIEIFSSKANYEKTMKNVKKSKKLYYLIDKYEHGNVHYSVASTEAYPDSQFDVAKGCGIYIPNDEVQEQYKKMKRKQGENEAFMHFIPDSNIILESYSNWCNGEIYNATVMAFDKNGVCIHETNLDFISGYDNSLQSAEGIVKQLIIEYKTEDLLKNVIIENKTLKDVKNLPFKIKQKDLIGFKHVHLFDQHLVSATYENNNGTFYQYKENDLKPAITKFNFLPEDIKLDEVLNSEMELFMKKIISSEVKAEIEKKISKVDLKLI